jgi:serine/threonine protein phosphatase 1
MIGRLFRRAASFEVPRGILPQGQRVYAIGDIHGRLDLLDQLLAELRRDNAGRGPGEAMLLFLGDLIDRGPESAQVIDRAIALQRDEVFSTRFLIGNHEEVFLSSLAGDERSLKLFTKIGGRETILSYGVSEEQYNAFSYEELLEELPRLVPQAHTDFLNGFEDMIVLGDYAFVHAGVDPLEPLARQQTASLRWIRNNFLDHKGDLEKVIVHGHTISEEVEYRRHRIGLDTGAYRTGKLTAMGFEGDRHWVVDTSTVGQPA